MKSISGLGVWDPGVLNARRKLLINPITLFIICIETLIRSLEDGAFGAVLAR